MRLSAIQTIREKKTLVSICLGILCVMIVAAFRPFTLHPTNHVAWLVGEDGLRFNGGGIVLSPKHFAFTDSQSPAGASLELWLEPSQDKYSNALLSFSSRENPERFRLRQSRDFLLILQEAYASSRRTAMTWLWVHHAFQAHKRTFIAICSGAQGTTVYLDGALAEHSSTFKLTSMDFTGQLIVGASPTAYDSWRGKMVGLAVFGRELNAAQVLEHYQAWQNGRAQGIRGDQPIALYTFAERSGNIAHNQVVSGPELTIPVCFSIPYKPFMQLPWREFYPNRGYLQDVLINIVGFVPFGFFFCMLLASSRASRKAMIATIILGAMFSSTIEVLQWFIPMRDSGTTDIITNTLGTALGATLYCRGTVEALLVRIASRLSPKPGLQ